MTYCTWQPDGDGYTCNTCGVWRRVKVRRVCRSDAEQQAEITARNEAKRKARQNATPSRQPPPLTTRATSYTKALARLAWHSIKAGRLLERSEAEYLRVRAICEACPQWDAEKEACKICGCGGRSKVVLLNKLRIETEKCPEGKW